MLEIDDGAVSARARARRIGPALVSLAVALACACLLSAGLGAVAIPPTEVALAMLHRLGLGTTTLPAWQAAALFDIRLPRLVLAVLVGATLGLAGTALQALFRNPLTDPGLIGMSSGGACGAVGWIVLGDGLAPALHGPWSLPICAFAGSLAAVLSLRAIAGGIARNDVSTLLLAGIATNALCGALVGIQTYLGDDGQIRSLSFWMMGGLGGAGWQQIRVAAILMAVAGIGLVWQARGYDLLALGEDGAAHLGLSVPALQLATVLMTALGVGAAVALSGAIGFVGLAAPHLTRLLVGGRHARLLPGAALLGGLLVVLADLAARLLVRPAELPVGIVTSALGAPFFVWLLRHGRAAQARA